MRECYASHALFVWEGEELERKVEQKTGGSMSNGGLAGIAANGVSLPTQVAANSSERSKQKDAEKSVEAGASAGQSEGARTAHSTGKTLNVAA
jgi:hypothetical protein